MVKKTTDATTGAALSEETEQMAVSEPAPFGAFPDAPATASLSDARAHLKDLSDSIGPDVNAAQEAMASASKYLLGLELPAFNTAENSTRAEVVQEMTDKIETGLKLLHTATADLLKVIPVPEEVKGE